DWPGLLETVLATGAETIGVTHGHTAPFIRYLQEQHGLKAYDIPTRFTGETATGEEADGTASGEDAS
ncbi:MAG: DNA ligase-associated DEXH box helicase, partial [Verrucomicrobiota bacterium]